MGKDNLHQHTLANGLVLLGDLNHSNKSAAVGFFVNTGSRDEEQSESGVSHFLEHMMFKGTSSLSAIELTYALGNIGAQANAYTNEENTVFYASVIPERFSEMQSLLCDMLRSSLDPQEFETERKVILEEIALYQDRPHFYLFENAFREYFGSHPAGNSVLGTSASISAMGVGEMRGYFERRYAPSNMVLAAAGAFDWEQFAAAAEDLCGDWKSFPAARVCSAHTASAITRVFRRPKLQQAHVLFVAPAAAAQDEERYALSVLAAIIGDATGSRLYWKLIESGIAESAGAESDERDGVGCFAAYAATEPDRIEEVSGIVRDVISTPALFEDADLERAKCKLIAKVVLGGELPLGRLMSAGTHWIYHKKLYRVEDSIARISGVDRSAIAAALARFPLSEWSEFRLLPDA